MLTIRLTPLQAEALLQLAGEADFATFEGFPQEARRCRAGERAMEKLAEAIQKHEDRSK
jgi:hypothetical protein